jgi:transglutaminase-like putative cysteine protease
MRTKILFLIAFIFFISPESFSQDKAGVKFGKISPQDFEKKVYSVDSNANAVVIADIGSSQIVGNSKGWFSFEYKRYRRVRILNKNGYDEANVEIPLFTSGTAEEQLDNIKAVTYNFENGKVTENKLEKSNIFKDKLNKYWAVKKFTFPNIKEGSIIEYEITVLSDFLFNLQPWSFQGTSPVLWSEYNLRIPEFLDYVFLSQGYQKFEINERKDNRDHFIVRDTHTAGATESLSFDATVTDHRWVMKNVPALKEESYTSTLQNHLAKLEFQLAGYRYPLTPRNVMGTWQDLTAELLRSEYFGATLDKNNGWLSDAVKPLINDAKNDLEKAKRIYTYVRDNYTCTSHNARELDQSLKNVFKNRNGSVAEINLLLTAIMKYANIQAYPVLLSTRSHGYTNSLYPAIDRFNYVICNVNIGSHDYYLDASHPRLGFDKLTPQCYNGHSRIVNVNATPIEFSSDSLQEISLTSLLINTNDKGEIEGSMDRIPGYYESHDIREQLKEKGQDEFFKSLKKSFGQDGEIFNSHIDSINNLEERIGIHYDFKLKQDKEDIVYLNPMFGEGFKENPFKSAERFYPVEMPYTLSRTYNFTMIVPDGYVVDELPKPTIVKLNEADDGLFEYRISASAGTISLRCAVKLNRTYYLPKEYDMLREFFNLVVKKQNEQIVLKKKK